MAIPNWIIRIEEKAVRERALGLWADLQRVRDKADLERQQVVREADLLYTNTVRDTRVKRDRAVAKARVVYDREKEALLKTVGPVLKAVESAH